MKQIILIRHAKVDTEHTPALSARELQAWVAYYDHAGIDPDSLPSQEAIDAATNADILLCSTLRRTADSAALLGVVPDEKHAVFNELPLPDIQIPLLKFKAKTWLFILRVLMLSRIPLLKFSWKDAQTQAEKAAESLVSYTEKHHTVTLIGHGGMHWMTQKILRKQGWKLIGSPSHENWGITRLLLPNEC